MNLTEAQHAEKPKVKANSSIQEVSSFNDLSIIQQKGCNIAIMSRPISSGIHGYVANLKEVDPNFNGISFDWNESVQINIENFINLLPRHLSLPHGREHLAMEFLFFSRLLQQIAEADYFSLRFEKIENDACRLFHTDRVCMRLLCTYLGPGTEYLDNQNADRTGIGSGLNSKIVRDPTNVRSLNPGDVALLKGDTYPGETDQGVVHRSPPIQGKELTRWVLRITSHYFNRSTHSH